LLLQLAVLFGAVYTLNQMHDIETDRRNRKLFFLPEGLIPMPAARRFTLALNIAALLLSVAICATHPEGVGGCTFAGFTLAIMVLGYVYSAGPAPWKGRPILGLIANIVAHGAIVFWMGVAFAGGSPFQYLVPACGYMLAVGAVYLATTVADLQGDRSARKATLAVLLGAPASMRLAVALILSACAVAWSVNDWLLLISAALALPLFIHGAIHTSPVEAARAARAAVGILTIAALLVYPPYLVLLLSGFLGTRLFFRWRFNMTYPRLI
jgi:1,4-dihydroxy-2-naphthoate octaprenyltransferase